MDKKFHNIDSNNFNFFDASVIYKCTNNPQKDICLHLNDYSNKEMFDSALTEMLDGKEDEYTFDCYQEIPDCFLDEENNEVSEKYWEFLQALAEATEEDAFIAYLNNYYYHEYIENLDFDMAVNECNDRYHGHWGDEVEFAENLVNDCYDLDVHLGTLAMYFDYKALARDIFINDYDFVDGYVFSSF